MPYLNFYNSSRLQLQVYMFFPEKPNWHIGTLKLHGLVHLLNSSFEQVWAIFCIYGAMGNIVNILGPSGPRFCKRYILRSKKNYMVRFEGRKKFVGGPNLPRGTHFGHPCTRVPGWEFTKLLKANS